MIHLVKPGKMNTLTRRSLDCSALRLAEGSDCQSRIAMVQDSIVVFSTNSSQKNILSISGIEQISIEDMVTQNLEQGNL